MKIFKKKNFNLLLDQINKFIKDKIYSKKRIKDKFINNYFNLNYFKNKIKPNLNNTIKINGLRNNDHKVYFNRHNKSFTYRYHPIEKLVENLEILPNNIMHKETKYYPIKVNLQKNVNINFDEKLNETITNIISNPELSFNFDNNFNNNCYTSRHNNTISIRKELLADKEYYQNLNNNIEIYGKKNIKGPIYLSKNNDDINKPNTIINNIVNNNNKLLIKYKKLVIFFIEMIKNLKLFLFTYF